MVLGRQVIRYCTSFLRAGVDPKVVKQMGCWKSDAFLLYWRELEEIFSDHAAMIDWSGLA